MGVYVCMCNCMTAWGAGGPSSPIMRPTTNSSLAAAMPCICPLPPSPPCYIILQGDDAPPPSTLLCPAAPPTGPALRPDPRPRHDPRKATKIHGKDDRPPGRGGWGGGRGGGRYAGGGRVYQDSTRTRHVTQCAAACCSIHKKADKKGRPRGPDKTANGGVQV